MDAHKCTFVMFPFSFLQVFWHLWQDDQPKIYFVPKNYEYYFVVIFKKYVYSNGKKWCNAQFRVVVLLLLHFTIVF